MKQSTKTLLLWALLILVFLAVWQFLSPGPGRGRPPAPSEPVALGSWLPTLALCAVIFAALFAYRRLLAATGAHNAAIHASNAHLGAGRFDEAERAVQALAGSRLAAFRRSLHVQRAAIAVGRGDREGALSALEAARAEPVGRIFRREQEKVLLNARSLRAFVRASGGDEAGAREDIEAVRAAADAEPVLQARAALAEARLLDEAGDRAALAALLERSRPLLLAATWGRERALVRAYEAMLEAKMASVYRQKGDRVGAGDEAAAIAAWVARFAPNAAPFVRAVPLPAGGEPTRAEAPSAEARRRVEASRPKSARDSRSTKTLALWVVLIMIFLVVWNALGAGHGATGPVLLIAGVGGVILYVARNIRRSARQARRIAGGARLLAAGDLAGAASALAFETEGPLQRAQVAHLRAEVALRGGDMAEALAQCDRSFVALALHQGGKVTPPTAPAAGTAPTWDLARVVTAQRALALAVLGRDDEAWAEIAWAQGFPDELPVFHVLLATRLAAGDYPGAAAVVEGRDPALTLPAHDETLSELVRFVGRPAARAASDAARLRAELRRDRDLGRWIEAMAPGLSAAFQRAAAETEIAGHDGGDPQTAGPAGAGATTT